MIPLKIALINPPYYVGSEWAKNESAPFNIGLGYVSSFIEKYGYKSDIYDFSCYGGEDINGLINKYNLDKYDIAGFSVYSQTYKISLEMAFEIKKRNKNTIIIFGGPHATAVNKDIILNGEPVDYVIMGDGEIPFLNLLKSIENGQLPYNVNSVTFKDPTGNVINNKSFSESEDLNILPYPHRHSCNGTSSIFTFYDIKHEERKKAVMISASRGCPYRCTFCIIIQGQKKYRSRSIESVLQEINDLFRQHALNHIWFVDPDYLYDPYKALSIGKGIKTLGPNITWHCTGRADHIINLKHILPDLVDTGLICVEVGIESGSDSVLKRWNKGTTVKMNKEAIDIIRNAGCVVGLDFIMFDPLMTKKDIENNIQFIKDMGFYGTHSAGMLTSEVKLYPSTPLRKYYAKRWKTNWDPNIVPNYEFEDADVKKIYELVKILDLRYLSILNIIIPSIGDVLYAMRSHENYTGKKFTRPIMERLQNLQLSQHALSIAPYVIFEKIVYDKIHDHEEIDREMCNLLNCDFLSYIEGLIDECTHFNKYFNIS